MSWTKKIIFSPKALSQSNVNALWPLGHERGKRRGILDDRASLMAPAFPYPQIHVHPILSRGFILLK